MITQPTVPSTAAVPAGEGQGGVAWIVRAHAEQHGLVRATGSAHGTDLVRATVPRRSLALTPANPIVDIGQSRIRCLRRHENPAATITPFFASASLAALPLTISPDPGPAMQFDHDRERSCRVA